MKPPLPIAAVILPVILLLLPALTGCSGTYKPSKWLDKVPPSARAQLNPLPPNRVNVAAGRDTYALYCATCHGEHGAGRHGRPSLRTARIHGETDGDIFWILKNGSRNHGMPSWRSLGNPALWQLVQYIRSLPPQAAH